MNTPMRYLITGAQGMLGRDLHTVLVEQAVTVTPLSRYELDITNQQAVQDAIEGHDIVINAAAYTRVDDAETNEDTAHAVNAIGAQNIAVASEKAGARLIQISTDYVFDGKRSTPYPENAPLSPLSIYGRTKAEGENLVRAAHPHGSFIVRTAWLYGAHGPNFVTTILRLAEEKPTLTVANDQHGQPTWTMDLAHQLILLANSDAPAGIYHATNSGKATRYEFAQAIFTEAGLDPQRIQTTTSDTLRRPAPRPSYSVLGHEAWAANNLPALQPWREALHDAATHGVLTS